MDTDEIRLDGTEETFEEFLARATDDERAEYLAALEPVDDEFTLMD